jgi:hypothetical protein
VTHAGAIGFVLVLYKSSLPGHGGETTVLVLVLLPLEEDLLLSYFRILFQHLVFQLLDVAQTVPLGLLVYALHFRLYHILHVLIFLLVHLLSSEHLEVKTGLLLRCTVVFSILLRFHQ